ncbi:hypothetical protein EV175_000486 [Coemansia sp. RSA 1933]|nr:hypothetical protein EV175_000486 [Coemansia sp. RSA 1933]
MTVAQMDNKDTDTNRGTGQRTVEFCPADSAIYPRCTMQLYYHNKENHPGFMEFGVLKESLYQTLRNCMPIALATEMKRTSSGGLTAVVHENPEYPQITRHEDREHSVAGMEAAGYSAESQPQALVGCAVMANPLAGDALVVVDVVYMMDGVGLSFAMSHALLDIVSLVMVSREWGCLARAMYLGTTPGEHQRMQQKPLDTNREIFWQRVSADKPAESLKIMQHLDQRWKTEQASPGEIVGIMAPVLPLYRIRISAKSVEALKNARPAEYRDISVSALLAAAMWQAHTQANADCQHTYLGLSLTVRTDKRFAEFCGNTAAMDYMHDDPAHINSMGIYDVARVVQRRIRGFTNGDFAQVVQNYSDVAFVEKLQRLILDDRRGQAMIAVVMISRLPCYDVDFGYGRPCKLMFAKGMTADRFCFMVPESPQGGIEVYVRISKKCIELMEKSDLLSGHIEAVEY